MTSPHQSAINLPAQSHSELVKLWKQCKSYYEENMKSNNHEELLLSLTWCCYKTKNSKACGVIANHLYTKKVCRLDIPPINATPYLLLAVSYFISRSGKTWSLRCNNALSVSLLSSSSKSLLFRIHESLVGFVLCSNILRNRCLL